MLEHTKRQVFEWKFLQHALCRYVCNRSLFDILTKCCLTSGTLKSICALCVYVYYCLSAIISYCVIIFGTCNAVYRAWFILFQIYRSYPYDTWESKRKPVVQRWPSARRRQPGKETYHSHRKEHDFIPGRWNEHYYCHCGSYPGRAADEPIRRGKCTQLGTVSMDRAR